MGSVAVAAFLLAGGVGIGMHSLELMMTVINAGAGQEAAAAAATKSHGHGDGLLDPNAAWFAAISVIAKEWLYRASKLNWIVLSFADLLSLAIKVGKAERSEVLIANAWYIKKGGSKSELDPNGLTFCHNRHHRSDAYSSAVALVAILGSYAGLPVLDPIGGLLISGVILKQGGDILSSSLKELMDKGISQTDVDAITRIVKQVKVSYHSIDY